MNQTAEQDLIDIRFLRQMTIENERELKRGEIDIMEYKSVLSRIISHLEILEGKYGILVD